MCALLSNVRVCDRACVCVCACSSDNWGGTPIQHWMSAAALSKCTSTPDSILYNAMIAPLQVGPLALTGAVWYQVPILP